MPPSLRTSPASAPARPNRCFRIGSRPPQIKEAGTGRPEDRQLREGGLESTGRSLRLRVIGRAVFARAPVHDHARLVEVGRAAGHGQRVAHVADLINETMARSEEHTSELQSLAYLVCRLLLEKKKKHQLERFPLIPVSISAGVLA